jgi:hypothetical protein
MVLAIRWSVELARGGKTWRRGRNRMRVQMLSVARRGCTTSVEKKRMWVAKAAEDSVENAKPDQARLSSWSGVPVTSRSIVLVYLVPGDGFVFVARLVALGGLQRASC